MAATSSSNVDLGFVEECFDRKILESRYFPSKVGGKPAWLSLQNLPAPESLTCPKCGEPCIFLLQAYAPRENKELAFHRTIFVFVCKNPECCMPNSAGNFKVFRSQLPRVNEFYSAKPPNEKDPEQRSWKLGVALCVVCGSSGPKKCGKCHSVSYCSKRHQELHWKASHKRKCSQETVIKEPAAVPGLLFPERELVMEEEELPKDQANLEKTEEEKFEEYHKFLRSNRGEGKEGLSGEDLEKSAVSESADDKQFLKFRTRVAASPDQILRYEWGGEPLWISARNKVEQDNIPPCTCGAKRHFEFQVLPQLLNHLKVDSLGDSIDWGTLCVYTCSDSCDIGNNYHTEFLWKQDIVADKE